MGEGVMATEHKVKQGECISSIAAQYGLFPETIWDDPANADLKEQRADPNVLSPGDVVVIPDKRAKEETGGTEQRHRFRRKGVPAMLRLQIKRDDQPRANVPFVLTVDGTSTNGTTDGDGMVEVPIPPGARQGELKITEGDVEEIYPFRLGTLDPLDSEEGVRGRLRGLGYDDSLEFADLVREFQHREGLDPTSHIDEPTKAKLREVFGQ
jgi:N-acetylmuramoyl-L-alanine amidase